MKLILTTLLILLGCSEQSIDLNGKWSYTNPQGSYSEVWFNSNQIVLIDADFYSVTIADYRIEDDAILIYYGEELQNKLMFSIKSADQFLIGDSQDIVVIRFDTTIAERLDYSDETVEAIQQEFGERAQ